MALVRRTDGYWLESRDDGERPLAAIRPSWWSETRKIPAALRSTILDRDGHRCAWCGSTDELQVDHIYPLARGGDRLDPYNLQILCGPCNRWKSDRVIGAESDG